MDISKEYIEMCEKAQEIQNYRQTMGLPSKSFISYKGDWFCHVGGVILVANQDIYQKPGTWLPRQDQLQEIMLEDKCRYDTEKYVTVNEVLLDDFNRFVSFFVHQKGERINSFEQYWLKFVMKEKFNKIWNNEIKNWETIL